MKLDVEPRGQIRPEIVRWPRMSAEPAAREMQILYLVALGYTNGAIGGVLYLSADTVKTHLRRLFVKLGARDRAHAVNLAHRQRLLAFDGDGRLMATRFADEMPEVEQ